MSCYYGVEIDPLEDPVPELVIHVYPVGHHVDSELSFVEISAGEASRLYLGEEPGHDALYSSRGRHDEWSFKGRPQGFPVEIRILWWVGPWSRGLWLLLVGYHLLDGLGQASQGVLQVRCGRASRRRSTPGRGVSLFVIRPSIPVRG